MFKCIMDKMVEKKKGSCSKLFRKNSVCWMFSYNRVNLLTSKQQVQIINRRSEEQAMCVQSLSILDPTNAEQTKKKNKTCTIKVIPQ